MTNLFGRIRQFRLGRAARQPGDPVQAYGAVLDQATKHDLDVAIASVFFGFLFTVVTGFPGSSPLFTAFLKERLGLSSSAYGLVLTIPYLMVLVQIPYSLYARCHNNIKPVFITFATLAKLVYLVPAFMPFIFPNPDPARSTLIIAGMMVVGSTCNWIADSSINTWFGAMIPAKIKGIYFSTRQTVFTMAALAYSLGLSVARCPRMTSSARSSTGRPTRSASSERSRCATGEHAPTATPARVTTPSAPASIAVATITTEITRYRRRPSLRRSTSNSNSSMRRRPPWPRSPRVRPRRHARPSWPSALKTSRRPGRKNPSRPGSLGSRISSSISTT